MAFDVRIVSGDFVKGVQCPTCAAFLGERCSRAYGREPITGGFYHVTRFRAAAEKIMAEAMATQQPS